MTYTDAIYTVGLLVIGLVLCIAMVAGTERYLFWRHRRMFDRLKAQQEREWEREQRAWRSTWGGDY